MHSIAWQLAILQSANFPQCVYLMTTQEDDEDYRIFFVNSYSGMARSIICEVSKIPCAKVLQNVCHTKLCVGPLVRILGCNNGTACVLHSCYINYLMVYLSSICTWQTPFLLLMIFITGRQAKSHLSPLCLDYIWLVPGWLVDKSSVKKRYILQWSAAGGFYSEDQNVTNPAVSYSKWLWWINHLWNCKADNLNLEFSLASSVSILHTPRKGMLFWPEVCCFICMNEQLKCMEMFRIYCIP